MPSKANSIPVVRRLANATRGDVNGDPTKLRASMEVMVHHYLSGKTKAELLRLLTLIWWRTSGPPSGATMFTGGQRHKGWAGQLEVWLLALVWEELQEEFLAGELRQPTPAAAAPT
jgi:hypothetical protein